MSTPPPNQQAVSWPSTVVAVAVIAVVGTVAVTAIVKYASVDEALKFWSALSGLVGLVTGAFVTYFFSRGNVQQAQRDKDRAIEQTNAAIADRATAVQAAGILAGHLDKEEFRDVKATEPAVERAFNG